MAKEEVPFAQRISVSVDDVVRHVGIGKSTVWSRIASGELKATRVGGRTLVLVSSVLTMLGAAQPEAPRRGRPPGSKNRTRATTSPAAA